MASSRYWRRQLHGSFALVALWACFSTPRADVVGIGDITPSRTDAGPPPEDVPDLPLFGGPVTGGNLIVGGTGQLIGGTSTGQMTIDIPSDTAPLESTTGVIGGNPFGFGLVRIVSLNSQWTVDQSLIVGNEGQGTIELTAGARLFTAGGGLGAVAPYDLQFAAESGSQGFMTVDGFGSLSLSFDMGVGINSAGSVEVLNRARLENVNSAVIGDNFNPLQSIVGEGYVLVEGAGSRWNVGTTSTSGVGTLTVGRAGRGTVEIREQGLVRVKENADMGVLPGSFGEVIVTGPEISGQVSQFWTVGSLRVGVLGTAILRVNERALVRTDGVTLVGFRGLVEMGGGTILTTLLNNTGVIRGDGRITTPLVTNEGDIRTAASIANLRERLWITGDLTNGTAGNRGLLESVGGEVEIEGITTNALNSQIFGRDAIFRFRGGLSNFGQIVLEKSIVETTTLVNQGNLQIEPSISTIEGAFTNAGVLVMDVGDTHSKLAVLGNATLSGTLDIDLRPGYTPRVGDFWEIITANSVLGTFTTTLFPPASGVRWDIDYNPTNVIINLLAGFSDGSGADFDNDGDVDGNDLTILKGNFGLSPALQGDGDADGDGDVDGADFMKWQDQMGDAPPFPVQAAGAPVPEPGTLALAAMGLAGLALVHRRQRAAC